jgi:subtilase family serine protease
MTDLSLIGPGAEERVINLLRFVRRVRFGFSVVVIGLALRVDVTAVDKPQPADRVLPDFDRRAVTLRRAAPTRPVQSATDRLRRSARSPFQIKFDPGTGAVRLLTARNGVLDTGGGRLPRAAALAFLGEHADLFRLTSADLESLALRQERRVGNGAATHVAFDQFVDGIEVFGGALGVNLDRAGGILSVWNTTTPTDDLDRRQIVSAEAAIQIAVADIRPELGINPVALAGPAGPDQHARYGRGPFRHDIDARLVYVSDGDRLGLAWRMLLEPTGFPQAYDMLVDAVTGEVLYRWNTYRYAEGTDGQATVLQSDATMARDPRLPDRFPAGSTPPGPGDPPDGCPPIVNYATRSLTAPFRDPLSVLFDGGRLTGNNTQVFRSAVGTLGAFGTPTESDWVFAYPFNTADSAEAALFFAVNFVHDFFYDLGFDEAAGNFQVDNFGRGGVGGDSLQTVARAPGRNNATFQPAPEGTSPVMRFFLWDGLGCWAADVDGDGTSDLDSSYDLDIVIHEYHHGVSTRLNPNFLGNEAAAIGEGGSDFFAYSVTGDTRLAEYARPPYGIREINGKTYADWFCLFGLFCEPHDNGEIWANVLWDLRERFRTDLVGGSPAAGIDQLHRLYIDGLALSPASPTMLDLRDAMLVADQLRNPSSDPGGSTNHCRMWREFARRGMGTNAQDTKDAGPNAVVADFNVPEGCGGGAAVSTVTIAATGPATEAGTVPGSFTVTRSEPLDVTLPVTYTASGTATPSLDYTPVLSGVVAFDVGAATATFQVTPVDDTQVESDETVVVTLGAGFGYTVSGPASASLTIVSDDALPDLVVSALSGPPKSASGAAITLQDTTRNQGGAASSASLTTFYLSANLVVEPSDAVLGSRTIAGLAPAAESAGASTVTLPSGLAAGSYYVIAKANADGAVTESQIYNNLRWIPVQIGPDLVLSNISMPATAGAGISVIATETTRNDGAGSAGASVTRFFLSSNLTLDAGDAAIGNRQVGGLSPGAESPGTTSLTIPAGTATGSYWVLVKTDADESVPESQEANNVQFRSVLVGPDLMITAVTGPATAGAGSTIVLGDTTKNQGAGAAAGSTTKFYLSTNFTLDAEDVLLGSRAVGTLGPGGLNSGSAVATIPLATQSGTYYVLARADGDGAVPETQEGNNLQFRTIQVGADLTISTMQAPAIAGPGVSVALTDTTKNQGTSTADPSTTRFLFSTNFAADAGDTALGTRSVPSLAPGATSTGTTTVTIPPGAATGTYYLIAQADAHGVVVETQEANNTAFRQILIGPDLAVTTASVQASAPAGSTISVGDTTRNMGGGAANPSATAIYLSTNFTIDAADALLGQRSVPALDAGASSAGTTQVVIPAATAPGTYYLLIRADVGGDVVESQELNNVLFRSLQVVPGS